MAECDSCGTQTPLGGILVDVMKHMNELGITYLIFRIANLINKVLGQRGSMIVTRVFAVIVAAIAIQYIIQGVGDTIPNLRLIATISFALPYISDSPLLS